MKTVKILSPIIVVVCCVILIFCSTPQKHFIAKTKPGIANQGCQPLATTTRETNQAGKQVAPGITNHEQDYSTGDSIVAKVGYSLGGYDPRNSIFVINMKNPPRESEKIYLEYELFGMEDFTCVPHSINDNLAVGGYWSVKNNKWSHQHEQVSASNLRQGRNVIRFTAPDSPEFKYMVKNLKIHVEPEQNTARQLVVNQPTTAYYYKRFGYVQGFVQGYQSDKAVITISGKKVPTNNSVFEQLVQKPENTPEQWFTTVVATFPDGEKIESRLQFNHSIDCELLTDANKAINFTETSINAEGSFDLHLNGLCVDAKKGALKSDTKISIFSLRDIDFPTMDPGMVNVTEKAGGYRCLPHGTTFSSDIRLSMEYDPSRLPLGYTPQDIYTYYFDEQSKQWVALQRDTVDIANNIIVSRTTHFTDFINGIIKVPESPLTQAYTPTSIKDIKAANPLEAMDVIQPPTANNIGNAKLGYPLVIPPGRKGMQPQLVLQYASDGGNGWMGLGWNISLPSISVETRWGVPRYDVKMQSETYLVNGEQVTTKNKDGFYDPMPHRSEWVNRISGDVQYYKRVEGAFDSIIRHGKSPSDYWWEVIDRNGIKSFYGKKFDKDELDPLAVLIDDNGNIAYWALTETKDLHNNAVRYYYEIVKDAGVPNGVNLGKQIYISQINYTGTKNEKGLYDVYFQRYDKTPTTTRRDVIISGRYGFKEVTADMLRRITITYKDEPVRRYYFGYRPGEFDKMLLCGFYEADAGDDLDIEQMRDPLLSCRYFHKDNDATIKTHTFNYFNDYNSQSPGFEPFGSENIITTYPDTLQEDGMSSAINESKIKQWGAGGSLNLGFGAKCFLKNLSVGGDYQYNKSRSKDQNVVLFDLNGDGLPDKVFSRGSGLYYRKQYLDATGTYRFANSVEITGPSNFLYQETQSNSWGGQVCFGVKGSYHNIRSTTTTSLYFADVNGDGFPDIVNNDIVYFNRLNSSGNPDFFAHDNDNDTVYVGNSTCQYSLYTGSVDDSVLIADRVSSQQSMKYDAVRVWIAPYDSIVSIYAPIQLIEDTGLARRMSRHTDGIRFTIQHNDNELYHDTIGPQNYSIKLPWQNNLPNIQVKKGDTLFFRLQSRDTRSFDKVIWDPVITYVGKTSENDPNNKGNYQFQASDDFVLDQNMQYGVPIGDSVKINGRIVMPPLSDSVRFLIIRNTIPIFDVTFSGAVAVNDTVDLTIGGIDTNDVFYFKVIANTNVDWNKISFKTHMYVIHNNEGFPVTNDDGSYNVEFYPVLNHSMFTKTLSITRPYTFTNNITIKPDLRFSSALNGQVVFSVKSNNVTIAKKFLSVYAGQILNNQPFQLNVTTGQNYFFEFFSMDTSLMYKLTSAKVAIQGNQDSLLAGSYTIHPSCMLKFGSLFRGWGQFTYNNLLANPEDPIVTSLLVYDNTMSNQNQMNSMPDTSSYNSFAQGFNSYYNPLNTAFILMIPDQKKDGYVGFGNLTTIKSGDVINYRIEPDELTLDDPIPLPAVTGKPVKTVRKQSVSENNSYSFGWGSVMSANLNDGHSESTMDYLDINGDRFPDIVGANNAQVSTPQGGLSDQIVRHNLTGNNSEYSTFSCAGASFGATDQQVEKVLGADFRSDKNSVLGVGVSSGSSSDHINYTWCDINGDGLPDKVREDGTAFLNLGYKFLSGEIWNNLSGLNSGGSTNFGAGLGTSYSIKHFSFAGGYDKCQSDNKSNVILQDINGDGLVDKLIKSGNNIIVNINSGNQLLGQSAFQQSSDVSTGVTVSKTYNVAVGFGFPIPIAPGIFLKIVFNPNYTNGKTINTETMKLIDMNGDGYPDYVTSYNDGQITVRYSTIGRTNLLSRVDNFLGGHFDIDYARVKNTVDLPHSTWTMSSLKVYDGFNEDGPDYNYYTFKYENGFYSRYERESFGFNVVKTEQHDSTQSSNVYRTTTENYHNNSFVFKNFKYSELTQNGSGNNFIRSTYKYYLKEIATGDTIPDANPECYGEGFPAISWEDHYFYEGDISYSIHTKKRYDHGPNGNIKTYFDDGDTADPGDDIVVNVLYHPGYNNNHVISIPSSIIVKHGITNYRKRETSINTTTGEITQIRMYNGSMASTYDLSYNNYGNLIRLAYPPNANGQRMVYYYSYESTVNTYVADVSDTLGYHTYYNYEYHYGKVNNSTDLTGQQIQYTYDLRGRLSSIRGPKEIKNNLPYTIRFVYWDTYGDLFYGQRIDNVPWARTYHYDPDNPTNNIRTVLFADAQGKILQTKKDVAIYDSITNTDSEKIAVSGRIYYDEYGRPIKTYYPIIEQPGADSVFNYIRDAISPTRITYDILDREDSIIKPDNAGASLVTTIHYDFGNDLAGVKRFLTTTKDAKGICNRTYTNPADKQTLIHSPYNTNTSFTYDPVGQLISTSDPEGKVTTNTYDMLGRRTQRVHPDAGTTKYEYDPAGNVSRIQTQNLYAVSNYIYYFYNFNRLLEVGYTVSPQNNVWYEYGPPNSGNQSGRLIKQQDANGIQKFTYDELGNVKTNIRTMIVPHDSIYTFGTRTTYDTWNRIDTIVYPDGEIVKYHYNQGGLLRNMSGVKSNITYTYVTRAGYDKYEKRTYMEYGNGTKSLYTYDPVRQNLKQLRSKCSNSQLMMNNHYAYDAVDNITAIVNTATPNNNIGGSLINHYFYDSLYRLDSSLGNSLVTNNAYDYNLKMHYLPSGKISRKTQTCRLNNISIPQLTYNNSYSYQNNQPHAPIAIGVDELSYDANGNLLTSHNSTTGATKYHSWDEENRMKLVTDQTNMGYYFYDSGGERTLKIIGNYSSMEINGSNGWNSYLSNQQTLYVSPYLVVKNNEYTKHYYIENERIVSKLGGGFRMDSVNLLQPVFGFNLLTKLDYSYKKSLNELMINTDLQNCGQPGVLRLTAGLYNFLSVQPNQNNQENDIYYYHGDHLGSTSYVTNTAGMPSQHVDYVPFGETLLEEHVQTWQTPYKFNCKELDGESGLYYYGARYYDPKYSLFFGVDPMAGKYPTWSPYTYCFNNPIRLIDPNGMEAGAPGDDPPTTTTKSLPAPKDIQGTFNNLISGIEVITKGPQKLSNGKATQVTKPSGGGGVGEFLNQAQYALPIWGACKQFGDNMNSGNYLSASANFLLAFAEALTLSYATELRLGTTTIQTAAETGANLATNGVKLTKQLASEAQMAEKGITIVGPGKLREAGRLAAQYGGKAADWVKKSSSSFTKNGTTFETHWYENISTGIRVEAKTKLP